MLFAACAVAFARATGSNPVLVQVMVSNRFRPGFADTVSPVAQPGLVVTDAGGVSFDEVVRDAWRATVKTSMYAYYDPFGQQALIDAMSERHGEPMDVRCFFNDRRMPIEPEVPGPPPSRGQLAETRSRSTLDWQKPCNLSDEPLMINIENADGTIACSVNFDTHYISPGRVETFLREMETVLISAAFGPAAPTRVSR